MEPTSAPGACSSYGAALIIVIINGATNVQLQVYSIALNRPINAKVPDISHGMQPARLPRPAGCLLSNDLVCAQTSFYGFLYKKCATLMLWL